MSLLECSHPLMHLVRDTTKGRYTAGCTDCEQLLAMADEEGLLIVNDPRLTEEARSKIENDFLLFLSAGAN